MSLYKDMPALGDTQKTENQRIEEKQKHKTGKSQKSRAELSNMKAAKHIRLLKFN